MEDCETESLFPQAKHDVRSLHWKMTYSASNPFVNHSRNFSGSILIFRAHLDGNGGRSPRACLCPTEEREIEMRQKIPTEHNATKRYSRW